MKGQGRDGFCPFFEDFCRILIGFFLGDGLRKEKKLTFRLAFPFFIV